MGTAPIRSLKTEVPQGFFLPTPAGRLAAMYHRSQQGVKLRGALFYIHPFGHELYHSRPVMASLFRALAAHGISTLSLDLPGCGDSAGEFWDARWSAWLTGMHAGYEWLAADCGMPVTIGGLRLGAPMALELAQVAAGGCRRVILLEPVLSGEDMMTQFLRLRVAFSGLRNVPEKRETTVDLRKRLSEGESIEVAGYLLTPELVNQIDGVSLARFPPAPGITVEWVRNQPASPAAAELAEAWTSAGAAVNHHQVKAKPWWVHTRAMVEDYAELALTVNHIFAGSVP